MGKKTGSNQENVPATPGMKIEKWDPKQRASSRKGDEKERLISLSAGQSRAAFGMGMLRRSTEGRS